MSLRVVQALTLLSGTIIGVGVFALPYVVSQTGLAIGLAELALLTGVVLVIHLMYADIAASMTVPHQLPGYAGRYLGLKAKYAGMAVACSGLLGSLIVYVILGSQFLATLLSPVLGEGAARGALWLFVIGGAIIFLYDSFVAADVDMVLTFALVALMAILIWLGITRGSWASMPAGNVANIAVPYGAILFALAGSSVIPRVRQMFGRSLSPLRAVIMWGTLIPALLYGLFVIAIIAATDSRVSPDAISGLAEVFGPSVVYAGAMVGFLATITSYIGVGLTAKTLIAADLKAPSGLSWALVSFVPVFLVSLGISDFIRLISLIGALAVGAEGALIIAIWRKLPKRTLLPSVPGIAQAALVFLFALGIVITVVGFD